MPVGALGYDSVDLSKALIDGSVVKCVPREISRRYRMLAMIWDEASRRLTVATSDLFNVFAMDQVRALLTGEEELDKAIERLYGYDLQIEGILAEIETWEIDRQSIEADSGEYSQPVMRLVNALLSDAVKKGASGVHFEPEHEFLRIRYRIDGVLRQIRSLCVQRHEFWPYGQYSCQLRLGQNCCPCLAARTQLIVFEHISIFFHRASDCWCPFLSHVASFAHPQSRESRYGGIPVLTRGVGDGPGLALVFRLTSAHVRGVLCLRSSSLGAIPSRSPSSLPCHRAPGLSGPTSFL